MRMIIFFHMRQVVTGYSAYDYAHYLMVEWLFTHPHHDYADYVKRAKQLGITDFSEELFNTVREI
jgi:hypothetical protein